MIQLLKEMIDTEYDFLLLDEFPRGQNIMF